MTNNSHDLIIKINNLQDRISTRASDNEIIEANQIAEELIEISKKKYDDISDRYAIVCGKEPKETDKKIWDKLLDLARKRVKSKQLGNDRGCLSLLDIGTGPGRDIKYASNIPDLKIIGIDNSDGIIKILKNLEDNNEISQGSYLKADMRDLSCFLNSSFDIIRHNASIIHLPIIEKGYMADLALAESYRVLKDKGLIYISVKEGKGLQIQFIENEEYLGGRIFQFYSTESLRKLVLRNGFKIISLWKGPSSRSEKITWIHLIAEKVN